MQSGTVRSGMHSGHATKITRHDRRCFDKCRAIIEADKTMRTHGLWESQKIRDHFLKTFVLSLLTTDKHSHESTLGSKLRVCMRLCLQFSFQACMVHPAAAATGFACAAAAWNCKPSHTSNSAALLHNP